MLAAADGTVVLAQDGNFDRWMSFQGFPPPDGNRVFIDHGNGWQTVYAHMEGFDVSAGDRVTPGQQIGRVGSTGRSTGPHVHVELRHNGERIDPAGYLPGL